MSVTFILVNIIHSYALSMYFNKQFSFLSEKKIVSYGSEKRAEISFCFLMFKNIISTLA